VILGVFAVVMAALIARAHLPYRSETLRQRVVAILEDRLRAKVELNSLTLRLLPMPSVEGQGLTVRHHGRTDVPPLFSVDAFRVKATFKGLWNGHIGRVELDKLRIQIPPRQKDDSTDQPEKVEADATAETPSDGSEHTFAHEMVIEELVAPDSALIILRADPNKPTRTWAMHSLEVRNVGFHTSMPFTTTMTNGIPPGEIGATGQFGPWAADDPGRTPLGGDFTLDDADLSVFVGISGMLDAKGSFGGTLDQIGVDGETTTPDFMVKVSGHQVPLHATYHAVVDGTNGNTTLDPVHATFLNTSLTARGGVYEVENAEGRVVRLDIQIEDGKLEDLMRLAVNTPKPPMTGTLHLTTKFTLPPGKIDVVRKLQLDGRFQILGGRFTDVGVQAKINDLSRRASNRMSEETIRKVTSDFAGRFHLGNGRLTLPDVSFDVPGAVVQLAGNYQLQQETLDFDGNLFMDAKISQTVRGFKSLLLKIVDPFFRKDGRTVVPLQINGTRSDPKFGVNVKRVFRKGDVKVPPSKKAPSSNPASKKPRPKT
jgi:hypothetical protein